MSGEAIQIRGVTKRFNTLEVLREIDISIDSGQTVAVLGPSGSGKSTLVRCINHLEPIQGGTIEFGPVRITSKGPEQNDKLLSNREIARFRTGVGMVFQSFNLFPHLTVLGNIVEAPRQVLKWSRAEATDRAMALL